MTMLQLVKGSAPCVWMDGEVMPQGVVPVATMEGFVIGYINNPDV